VGFSFSGGKILNEDAISDPENFLSYLIALKFQKVEALGTNAPQGQQTSNVIR
jgi:hypothetical protein